MDDLLDSIDEPAPAEPPGIAKLADLLRRPSADRSSNERQQLRRLVRALNPPVLGQLRHAGAEEPGGGAAAADGEATLDEDGMMDRLVAHAECIAVPPGHTFARAAAFPEFVFVVAAGRVELLEPKIVAATEEEEGEEASNLPRGASARAEPGRRSARASMRRDSALGPAARPASATRPRSARVVGRGACIGVLALAEHQPANDYDATVLAPPTAAELDAAPPPSAARAALETAHEPTPGGWAWLLVVPRAAALACLVPSYRRTLHARTALLRSRALFQSWAREPLTQLCDRMVQRSLRPDELLFRQNDPAEYCFLVTAGSVDVCVHAHARPPPALADAQRDGGALARARWELLRQCTSRDGAALRSPLRHVSTLHAGALVGEAALLQEGLRRNAAVLGSAGTGGRGAGAGGATILLLSKDVLLSALTERMLWAARADAAFNLACAKPRASRTSEDVSALLERVRALPFFARLAEEDARELCKGVMYARVGAGVRICMHPRSGGAAGVAGVGGGAGAAAPRSKPGGAGGAGAGGGSYLGFAPTDVLILLSGQASVHVHVSVNTLTGRLYATAAVGPAGGSGEGGGMAGGGGGAGGGGATGGGGGTTPRRRSMLGRAAAAALRGFEEGLDAAEVARAFGGAGASTREPGAAGAAGAAAAQTHGAWRWEALERTVGAGEAINETAAALGDPPDSSARAVGPVEVLAISRAAYRAHGGAAAHVAGLERTAALLSASGLFPGPRLAQAHAAAGTAAEARAAAEAELLRVAPLFTHCEIRRGEVLASERACAPPRALLLVSGECRLAVSAREALDEARAERARLERNKTLALAPPPTSRATALSTGAAAAAAGGGGGSATSGGGGSADAEAAAGKARTPGGRRRGGGAAAAAGTSSPKLGSPLRPSGGGAGGGDDGGAAAAAAAGRDGRRAPSSHGTLHAAHSLSGAHGAHGGAHGAHGHELSVMMLGGGNVLCAATLETLVPRHAWRLVAQTPLRALEIAEPELRRLLRGVGEHELGARAATMRGWVATRVEEVVRAALGAGALPPVARPPRGGLDAARRASPRAVRQRALLLTAAQHEGERPPPLAAGGAAVAPSLEAASAWRAPHPLLLGETTRRVSASRGSLRSGRPHAPVPAAAPAAGGSDQAGASDAAARAEVAPAPPRPPPRRPAELPPLLPTTPPPAASSANPTPPATAAAADGAARRAQRAPAVAGPHDAAEQPARARARGPDRAPELRAALAPHRRSPPPRDALLPAMSVAHRFAPPAPAAAKPVKRQRHFVYTTDLMSVR